MSKRTVFTTVTPLPAGITRETVMETLHSHVEMIDLNPLVEERHPIKPPPNATPEEFHCQWYSLTDRVQYLPGGMASGKVQYSACFHDLATGVQTHVYAPLGLNIKGKWTLGGSLPGEPIAPVELGVGTPLTGLWLREDVDMKCNFMMTSFVKTTLKKAHSTLVDRLLLKAQIVEASLENPKISDQSFRIPPPRAQGNVDYSPASDYSQESFNEDSRRESWGLSSYKTQTPQLQHGSFAAELPDSRDEKHNDPSLHPRPLSIRSSSSTFNGSMTGSQGGRSSYQDSTASTGRVSWQTLNNTGGRTPPMQHLDPARQRNPSSYHPSPLLYNPAEFAPQHRQDSWSRPQQSGYLPPPPAGPPPPKNGAFELE